MKITKFGHSCLLVEEQGVRLLFDPGEYSVFPSNLAELDAVLITHEHKDHYGHDTLVELLKRSPRAQVITNHAVGAKLETFGIPFQVIEDGQGLKIGTVDIEGEGEIHAVLHKEWPRCVNTGYRIGKRLFHPGDSLEIPKLPVEILALPVAGPWIYIGMAIDYAREIKPKVVFPIHDGILKKVGTTDILPKELLPKSGIEVRILEINQEYEF